MYLKLDRALKEAQKKNPKLKSVYELSDELGVSHTALYNWKSGKGLNAIVTVKKLMDATGLDFKQLFTQTKNNDGK